MSIGEQQRMSKQKNELATPAVRQAIEAAVFQRLVKHLQEKTEVQNIELMNVADFCRNCLSKWYVAAAQEHGIEADYEQVRELIYGMPYAQWKEKYQTAMTAEQKAALTARRRSE